MPQITISRQAQARFSYRWTSRLFLVAFAVFVLMGLWACTAGPPRNNAPGFASGTGIGPIKDVPFYPQLAYQCGPASLAGVLHYYGDAVTPTEIADDIFRQNHRGTLTLDMVLYARQKGFTSTWYSGTPEDIRRALDDDIPLIVMVDYGFAGISKNHFMVVVGYDSEGIIVNSGKTQEKRIGWDRFLTHWERAQRWTLRIEPKSSKHVREATELK